MKIVYKTIARVEPKSTMHYTRRFALLSLTMLCFSMPAHAVLGPVGIGLEGLAAAEAAKAEKAEYDRTHTSGLLAIIRVPVKLHHLLNTRYRVTCAAYDRPHGSIVIRGDGYTDGFTPLSGEVDRTVEVQIHPLRSAEGRTFPMATWQCHLRVNGHDSNSGLHRFAKVGQPYNDGVDGSWTLEAGTFIGR